MEPALLGLVVDSSVLVAAERSRVTTPEVIGAIREAVGDVAIVICSLTVAELAHGIYRAQTPERSRIIARVGAGQAAKGINLPLADLIIGACALQGEVL